MPDNHTQCLEPQIVMRLDSLEHLPPLRLPDGYVLRTYQPGDSQEWDRIFRMVFETDVEGSVFEAKMRGDSEFRADRVFFLCSENRPVATASAWHRPQLGRHVGYLHYVAVITSERGKRLGYHISLACLHKMRSEGRTAAMLKTDDFRAAAIKTYLKLGFRPLLVHENQRERWREILLGMDRPELLDAFRPCLEAQIQPLER